MSSLRMVVALVVALCATRIGTSQEKEPPLVLEITSKLGVRTKVEVSRSYGGTHDLLQQSEHLLTVDQGIGVYLGIQLRLVETKVLDGKAHKVTMTDGTVHKGNLRTMVCQGMTQYLLAEAEKIDNLTKARVAKKDRKLQMFRLRVAKPAEQTFDVYEPTIRGFGGNGRDGKTLPVKLNGEDLVAKPADFDHLAFFQKEKRWEVKLKAPEAVEKQCELAMKPGNQCMVFEMTNGVIVTLWLGELPQGSIVTPEFSLERRTDKEALPKIIEKKQ